MARIPRRELIDEFTVGAYHCVEKCVRGAYLCGADQKSGRDYSHRKRWIQRRMEFLAGQMAVEFLGFTVLSNHLHLILRNRPDVVLQWSDEEVARRWWNLCPGRKDKRGNPAAPRQQELERLTSDPTRLAVLRGRLSSISWLMRFLAEPIARRANREDQCTGRFWQGRYHCQCLLDEAALLACSIYVDLNPIRAGIAHTPETSEFTAAYQRIRAWQTRTRSAGPLGDRPTPDGSTPDGSAPDDSAPDAWLSPVFRDPSGEERPEEQPARRASNRGFLALQLQEYLALLDSTGRILRSDKRGAIPDRYAPILQRLGVTPALWIETVENFGRWFYRAAGRASSLAAETQRRGRRWLAGARRCRAAFD